MLGHRPQVSLRSERLRFILCPRRLRRLSLRLHLHPQHPSTLRHHQLLSTLPRRRRLLFTLPRRRLPSMLRRRRQQLYTLLLPQLLSMLLLPLLSSMRPRRRMRNITADTP